MVIMFVFGLIGNVGVVVLCALCECGIPVCGFLCVDGDDFDDLCVIVCVFDGVDCVIFLIFDGFEKVCCELVVIDVVVCVWWFVKVFGVVLILLFDWYGCIEDYLWVSGVFYVIIWV